MHECDVATRTLKLRRTKYCISAAGKLLAILVIHVIIFNFAENV